MELSLFWTKNELVFEANQTQFEPKKGPKSGLLWGIEVKICESKGGGGWATTRGATRASNQSNPRPTRDLMSLVAEGPQ